MNRFWGYDIINNSYIPRQEESLSVFPTIVNMKQQTVFCRQHKKWEKIAAFKQNVLKTECGKLYPGPFTTDNSIFNYNYAISQKDSENKEFHREVFREVAWVCVIVVLCLGAPLGLRMTHSIDD